MRREPENRKIVARVGRSLRSYGMPRARVDRLVAELANDLESAKEAGDGPESIVGADVRRFIADVAVAHGYEPVPLRLFGLTVATAIPLLTIAFVVYVVIMGGGPTIGLPYMTVGVHGSNGRGYLEGINEGWFILGTYLLSALLGLTLTLSGAAGYLALRGDTCIGRTIRNMLVLLPGGGVLGVVCAMAYAFSTDYSLRHEVIAMECIIVAAWLVGALSLGRRLARRPWGPRAPARLGGEVA